MTAGTVAPDCSNDSALGPPSANIVTHWPMVWASRSNARPTAAAVHPWPSSHPPQADVPPFPLSWRRRPVHPSSYLSLIHLPPLQQWPHPRRTQLQPPLRFRSPYNSSTANSTERQCGFHPGFGLGHWDSKALTSLVGLAPWSRDSGKKRGHRAIRGGRGLVRRTLYMCAWAVIRHDSDMRRFYDRLRESGKPGYVSVVAVMRKILLQLNAVARRGTPWVPQTPYPSPPP